MFQVPPLVVQGESNPHWPNKLGSNRVLSNMGFRTVRNWCRKRSIVFQGPFQKNHPFHHIPFLFSEQVMLRLGDQKPTRIEATAAWTTPGSAAFGYLDPRTKS